MLAFRSRFDSKPNISAPGVCAQGFSIRAAKVMILEPIMAVVSEADVRSRSFTGSPRVALPACIVYGGFTLLSLPRTRVHGKDSKGSNWRVRSFLGQLPQ